MKIHSLKILPEYFEAVVQGYKKFEIRENDRDYQVGDKLELHEFIPDKGYTGDYLMVQVTYMTDYAQKNGYVVMGIEKL